MDKKEVCEALNNERFTFKIIIWFIGILLALFLFWLFSSYLSREQKVETPKNELLIQSWSLQLQTLLVEELKRQPRLEACKKENEAQLKNRDKIKKLMQALDTVAKTELFEQEAK